MARGGMTGRRAAGSSWKGWVGRALLAAVAVVALLYLFRGGGGMDLTAPARSPAASRLVLRSADGGVVQLSDYRGEIVLVNLWATWCGACRAEIPGLERVQRRLHHRGFEILGVGADEMSAADLRKEASRMGISYPVFVPGEALGGTFRPSGYVPESWLLDRAGRVRATHVGYLDGRDLERAVSRLLAEPAAGG